MKEHVYIGISLIFLNINFAHAQNVRNIEPVLQVCEEFQDAPAKMILCLKNVDYRLDNLKRLIRISKKGELFIRSTETSTYWQGFSYPNFKVNDGVVACSMLGLSYKDHQPSDSLESYQRIANCTGKEISLLDCRSSENSGLQSGVKIDCM